MAVQQFTDSQVSKWAQDYEKELCAKYDLICDRLSLAVTPGVGEYELPNYVTSIRSVLYLGKELHPKSGRTSILTGDIPFQNTASPPYEYNFSGWGQRVLRLLPTPGDNISVYEPEPPLTLFSVEADQAAVIVEFYRTSNFAQGLVIPQWIRRYLLKDYVCFKNFASEGPQQDIRAAEYYEGKRQLNEVYMTEIKSAMFQSYQRVLTDNKMIGRRKPGHPVLPPNFGFPTYGG